MRKIVEKVKIKVHNYLYIAGLILNQGKRQVCTNIGRAANISHDKVYRSLQRGYEGLHIFSSSIKKMLMLTEQGRLGNIIIDDTGISKTYSRLVEAISGFFNTVLKRYDTGFKLFVIVWTDGKITIPIGFRYYLSKDIAGNMHKTKAKILEELLVEVDKYTKYNILLGDGHFSTIEIMNLLINRSYA